MNEKMSESGWYAKEPAKEVPIPVLGPDVFDPRKSELIFAETHKQAETGDDIGEEGEPK